MSKEEKTNVMRILDGKKITYNSYSYNPDPTMTGEEIASTLGENPDKVFKTLVTQGKSGQYYVFVIPVKAELNLKKAASVSDEKAITMIKQKELLPLTGYVHGGCSPIGMKKQFKTFLHETAINFDTIYISAGKVGYQIEISPEHLKKMVNFTLSDIVIDEV
ncbi:Cys-tRNA(Pro) deacylase [Butyrivibrio sp. YAB3001]|uniref:Cys-tRNA(Pro) deacylase n=1 Tax=Butyrivibrio sp. YAB3001 TaxID=1520812 RepID=UPI0008F6795C|nr:Cys-tRNA(Pro) deacylase [Butyrivibrio sp. YAB3001]SFD06157.1 Cys-tRNA(Pro)/Cys-tRNA(Cys) deacylase [Butyrivibrio sp. YAB3001]